jgi:hypothetical protein
LKKNSIHKENYNITETFSCLAALKLQLYDLLEECLEVFVIVAVYGKDIALIAGSGASNACGWIIQKSLLWRYVTH